MLAGTLCGSVLVIKSPSLEWSTLKGMIVYPDEAICTNICFAVVVYISGVDAGHTFLAKFTKKLKTWCITV